MCYLPRKWYNSKYNDETLTKQVHVQSLANFYGTRASVEGVIQALALLIYVQIYQWKIKTGLNGGQGTL